ncbi:hypothetical protein ZIOFF_006391 [Zingiber officinale]|uniref:Uncharacterized protein n=1 Tax=Zingiber officinale TaxID=94328 RepID=A0A8J5IBT1_ZINOF|nr:hypothetical protein ZIOFF_006391 [Zingiber officinale]
MRMEADHNLNFHYGGFFPPSLINQNVALFQPEATGLTSEGMYNSGEISSMAGMILPGNPGTQSHTSSVMSLPDNLSGSIALDPMSPVKHSATVATCWSLEELYVLRQGLMEHATEPTNIMKYIKIAAKLPEKQVRDVAMKCQLIAKEESGKRRKLENYHAEKKEKVVYSSSLSTMHSFQPESMTPLLFRVRNMPSNNHPCQEKAVYLDTLSFGQIVISSLAETFQVQDNINLFYHVRENIDNILTSMSVNPGIISQMAALAVSIDDNLFQSILPPAIQGVDHPSSALALLSADVPTLSLDMQCPSTDLPAVKCQQPPLYRLESLVLGFPAAASSDSALQGGVDHPSSALALLSADVLTLSLDMQCPSTDLPAVQCQQPPLYRLESLVLGFPATASSGSWSSQAIRGRVHCRAFLDFQRLSLSRQQVVFAMDLLGYGLR